MASHTSSDLLWSQLVAKAWCDESLLKRLQSEPRKVLAEHNLEVPEDMEVKVLEGTEVKVVANSKSEYHFVLTASPTDELTDEDLVGGAVSWCGCARCGSAVCGRCGACGCRSCW